jgi:hypothetical protein
MRQNKSFLPQDFFSGMKVTKSLFLTFLWPSQKEQWEKYGTHFTEAKSV